MTFIMREVYGIPGAQGSKRHVGRGVMVESSKRVKPWRDDVRAQFLDSHIVRNADPITGPVVAVVKFWFARPQAHYKANGELRPNAPTHPTGRHLGDIDKLLRSTFDAIVSSGAIGDDSQFVRVLTEKNWTDLRPIHKPGASITIYGAHDPGSGGQW